MRRNRGAVMTPEIRELELELQLLKRKRELLQHEQELLTGGIQQRQNNYYDPSSQMYNQQQWKQDYNFSQLYDDRPGSGNHSRQIGQKRHASTSWDSSRPPKRFQGSQTKPMSSPGPRSYQGFGSNKRGGSNFQQRSSGTAPQPLTNINAKPNFDDNLSRHGSTFRPARRVRPRRVTKLAQNTPNQLNSYPQDERKRLINETGTSAKVDTLILSADTPPTSTQLGRMELALGNILKEMRQSFGDEKYHDIFHIENLVKIVKQNLRDRIRSVMIGHPVGNMKNIIALYREKYSKETDKEIVDLAMEVADTSRREKRLAINLIPAETAESYVKINMGRLLNVKLNEMFEKLLKIYEEENGDTQKIIDAQIPKDDDIFKRNDDKYDPADAFESSDETIKKNETEKDQKDCSATADVNQPKKEESDTNDNNKEDKIDGTENVANVNHKNAINDKDDGGKKVEEEIKTDKASKVDQKDEISEEDAKFLKAWKLFNKKYLTADFYDRLINKSLAHKLPHILPSYKEHIYRILNTDQQYRNTKAAIFDKVTKDVKSNDLTKPRDISHTGENYYVRIRARPALPNRKLMTKFLETYNPLSIKKHKSIHNILFVRLGKDDFDKILEATGTQIGNITLSITVSDWKRNDQVPAKQIDSTQDIGSTNENDTNVKTLSEDMENQINDLLTSIRNDEQTTANEISTDFTEDVDIVPENIDSKSEQIKTEVTEGEIEPECTKKPQITTKKEEKAEDCSENNDNPKESLVNEEKLNTENKDEEDDVTAKNEQVETIKSDEKKTPATPTRASTRLSSGITTRRSSKLT